MSSIAPKRPRSSFPDLDITRMRKWHLKQVLRIEQSVYPRPWSLQLFLQEMSRRTDRSYIVAKMDGEVVGYAGMMYAGFEAHVTNIAVDPAAQGRKIGTRLLLTIITEAVARGAEIVTLEVRVSNRIAQDMYTAFGFQTVGVRKGYYIENKEDAYVMEAAGIGSTEYRLRLEQLRRGTRAEDAR